MIIYIIFSEITDEAFSYLTVDVIKVWSHSNQNYDASTIAMTWIFKWFNSSPVCKSKDDIGKNYSDQEIFTRAETSFVWLYYHWVTVPDC